MILHQSEASGTYTSAANKFVVETLLHHLDEVLQSAIGDGWPWYRELILESYERLSEAEDQSEIDAEIDDLLDLLISSPASDLIRKLLRSAQRKADTLDSGLRSGGSHVDAVPNQADLAPADHRTHALSSLQNIRLSSDAVNSLTRSQN